MVLTKISFNIYVEKCTKEGLDKARGVEVGRKRIKTIKYAHYQALLAESEEKLKCLMQNIVEVEKEFRMMVNVGKIK